jgi:3',5'-cyclic AMP phosphodiesterase CpdA
MADQGEWKQFVPHEDPLCSLIHFSDPHFGKSISNQGSVWHKIAAQLPVIKLVTGLYTHSFDAAAGLARIINRILDDRARRGIPTAVIHTGDLTATGDEAEFREAGTFVEMAHYDPLTRARVGLELSTNRTMFPFLDLPGNHDLWSRKNPRDAAFTARYGGAYPRTLDLPTRAGTVRVYALDSNRSTTAQHRLANGEIPAAQIAAVTDELQRHRTAAAIQVVALHHPLTVNRATRPRMLGFEVLKLKQRDAVAAVLKKSGAHLTLAGHVHEAQQHAATPERPLHFIAGTACQIGGTPSFWLLNLFPGRVTYHEFFIPAGYLVFDTGQQGVAPY